MEAAHAAARLGARTALVTLIPETIAQMSCNPAIGGIGKGQIVREVDALGGLMGLAADATGMQFRMLNRSKGPAVWGPRCQSDRHAYSAWMRNALQNTPNLTIISGEVSDIITEQGNVIGVGVTPQKSEARNQKSEVLRCRAAVVTAGTFLNGLMHMGERKWEGGRYDEPPAARLSESLRRCGLQTDRLKTGTCPRIAEESVDYSKCTRQDGDDNPAPFSFMNDRLDVEQVPCWLTSTTPEIHRVVKENLHRAPMYSGQIKTTGPRYCPSFETKIVRFPDKHSHQIFLEPEGRDTNWIYCNGIPTSLPTDVQEYMVRNIPGLERCEVLRWGYAIEYDFVPPTQLGPSLETKAVDGLFLAGQINGTTGYEEAAGQGLLAGTNAVMRIGGQSPLILRRDQAYIGVMVDDLVTKGVLEPYRMFTSRAEYRLQLRADNADRRLTEIGREAGLVGDDRWEKFTAKRDATSRIKSLLDNSYADGKPLAELLRRQDATFQGVADLADGETREQLKSLQQEHPAAAQTVAHDARYAGYLGRQERSLRQLKELENKLIPEDVDYDSISHLRHEARQRLAQIRPRSLGQALRISGITPSDITVLAVQITGKSATSNSRTG